ncbi:MAG: hypothetical protein JWN68_914 [Nocardioides sp.]|nr:hypothetical protein [Nocardioides sp.]
MRTGPIGSERSASTHVDKPGIAAVAAANADAARSIPSPLSTEGRMISAENVRLS